MLWQYLSPSIHIDGYAQQAMSGSNQQHDDDTGVSTETAPPELQPPPMYKVVMHNDDYTPMDFVVEVLQKFFMLSRDDAVQVMLTVHTKGKAIAGTFTAEIAETRAAQANEYARTHQHPLLCTMEKA